MRSFPMSKYLCTQQIVCMILTNIVSFFEINKQCKHILLTSCWNSIGTSLLQLATSFVFFHDCVDRLGQTYNQKRTSCSKFVDILQQLDQKPISGCICMACNSLLTTNLVQLANRLAAS